MFESGKELMDGKPTLVLHGTTSAPNGHCIAFLRDHEEDSSLPVVAATEWSVWGGQYTVERINDL